MPSETAGATYDLAVALATLRADAWLLGSGSLDDVAASAPQAAIELPAMRRSGIAGLALVLPTPGSPDAPPLPAPVIRQAMADRCLWIGLGGNRAWAISPLSPEPVELQDGSMPALRFLHSLPPRAAKRQLDEEVRRAASALSAMGLDRPSDTLADALDDAMDMASLARELIPAEALSLLMAAARIRAIAAVALQESGSAVTAGEMTSRSAAIKPLVPAARRAIAVAASWRFAAGGGPAQPE